MNVASLRIEVWRRRAGQPIIADRVEHLASGQIRITGRQRSRRWDLDEAGRAVPTDALGPTRIFTVPAREIVRIEECGE